MKVQLQRTVVDSLLNQGFTRKEIDAELLAVVAERNKLKDFRHMANGMEISIPTVDEYRNGPKEAVGLHARAVAKSEVASWPAKRVDFVDFGEGESDEIVVARKPALAVEAPAPKKEDTSWVGGMCVAQPKTAGIYGEVLSTGVPAPTPGPEAEQPGVWNAVRKSAISFGAMFAGRAGAIGAMRLAGTGLTKVPHPVARVAGIALSVGAGALAGGAAGSAVDALTSDNPITKEDVMDYALSGGLGGLFAPKPSLGPKLLPSAPSLPLLPEGPTPKLLPAGTTTPLLPSATPSLLPAGAMQTETALSIYKERFGATLPKHADLFKDNLRKMAQGAANGSAERDAFKLLLRESSSPSTYASWKRL